MTDKTIYITDRDLNRLKGLISRVSRENGRDRTSVNALKTELERAVVVPASEIPPYVITMNSRFRLKDLDTGDVKEYTLVFPDEADLQKGFLSVLAPIGTALLGYQDLDTIEWPVPAGRKQFRVEAILYQPEAAGVFQ